jgi:MFS family permease
VPPEIRRARLATSVVFAVHGTVVGSFAARIPWIAGHVGLDVGKLGIALLMPGIGSMIAMPFSGRLAHRHGLRALVAVTIAVYSFSLVLPSLPTTLVLLCVALAVGGALAGLADMAMNAEGSIVEARYGTSVMSSFHGCWSVGVLLGAGISALAAHQGLDTRVQFLIEAIALAAIGVVASRWLIEEKPVEEHEAPPMFSLPPREVVAIGLIGLFAVFGEIAGTDWSALYLRRELHGSAGLAALAVSALAFTMALTRLLGDHVIRRVGPVTTVAPPARARSRARSA